MPSFMQMIRARWAAGSFVCVGLDPEYEKLPKSLRWNNVADSIVAFNKAIIDTTADIVCAYKPNAAFYEQYGSEGLRALEETVKHILTFAPEIPVIYAAKRGDIGNTNKGYAKYAFEILKAHAITVHPYLGREAMQPFLDYKDKGVIVLCKTSNPGSGEFQDMDTDGELGYVPLYQHVAERVSRTWNTNNNCALVAGATHPEQLTSIRKTVGDLPLLIPGIGAQGGDLERTVAAGKDANNQGMIINSSRGIIYASEGLNFAEAARRETKLLTDEINRLRGA